VVDEMGDESDEEMKEEEKISGGKRREEGIYIWGGDWLLRKVPVWEGATHTVPLHLPFGLPSCAWVYYSRGLRCTYPSLYLGSLVSHGGRIWKAHSYVLFVVSFEQASHSDLVQCTMIE
jgi:hypothetical protein